MKINIIAYNESENISPVLFHVEYDRIINRKGKKPEDDKKAGETKEKDEKKKESETLETIQQ